MCRDYVVVLVHDVLDEVLVTDSKGVRESTKGWAGAGIIAGVGYRSHIRGGRGASRDNGWRQSSCRPPPLQGPPSKVPAPVPATKHLSVVLVWVLGSLWPSRMVPMAARRMGRLAFAAAGFGASVTSTGTRCFCLGWSGAATGAGAAGAAQSSSST